MDDVTLPPKYKPNRKESFMNLRQREYFRRKLLAWKEDILKEAQETLQLPNGVLLHQLPPLHHRV